MCSEICTLTVCLHIHTWFCAARLTIFGRFLSDDRLALFGWGSVGYIDIIYPYEIRILDGGMCSTGSLFRTQNRPVATPCVKGGSRAIK